MRLHQTILISAAALFLLHNTGQASYEKGLPWSGKNAGFAGATFSTNQGPEAVALNPAGLGATGHTTLHLDFSPAMQITRAPVVANSQSMTSKAAVAPFTALFAAHQLTEKLGVGVGVSVAGGTGSNFGQVNFGAPSTAEIIGTMIDIETALGLGYQVTDDLSVGAAWRISYLTSSGKNAAALGPMIVSSDISGMTGNDFKGFRLGALYAPKGGNWGVGTSFRSAVDWKLSGGTHTLRSLATDPATELATSTDAAMETKFPWQLAIGGFLKPMKELQFALGYEFINYAAVRETIMTSGAFATIGAPGGAMVQSMGWKNMHVIRLGGEYSGWAGNIAAGRGI